MHKLFAVTFGLAAVALCTVAQAQQYPTKPVKLIVTYPPGGSSDLLARVFGQKLSEIWGQPVVTLEHLLLRRDVRRGTDEASVGLLRACGRR